MALINTTTTGIQGTTIYADGTGDLTIQQNGATINKIVNQPVFAAYRSGSNQSISNATATKVQLNNEEFDTNNFFDSSTNYRFQPTIAGYYQLNGAISLNATTMTICIAFIYKNGSEFKRGTDIRVSQSTDSIATISTLVYANGSTDYFELYGYINASSGSPIFVGTQSSTWLQGFLIKAA
jgi:hypothetical protein